MVDAQCLIWAVDRPAKLTAAAVVALEDAGNQLLIGAGTMWELSIKSGLRKLNLSSPFYQWMQQAVADLGLTVMPISLDHCDRQTSLPFHHRDPFDRLGYVVDDAQGQLIWTESVGATVRGRSRRRNSPSSLDFATA